MSISIWQHLIYYNGLNNQDLWGFSPHFPFFMIWETLLYRESHSTPKFPNNLTHRRCSLFFFIGNLSPDIYPQTDAQIDVKIQVDSLNNIHSTSFEDFRQQPQLKCIAHETRRENKNMINMLTPHTTLNKRLERKPRQY